MVLDVNRDNFDEEVLNFDGRVLVDFWQKIMIISGDIGLLDINY